MNVLRVNTVFIPVTDMEASRGWYERALGLEVVADWGDYLDMSFPTGPVEGSNITLHRVSRSQPSRHSTFNLCTADPARMRRDLSDKGVRVTELNELGEYVHFDAIDPDGNEISIIGPAPGRQEQQPLP